MHKRNRKREQADPEEIAPKPDVTDGCERITGQQPNNFDDETEDRQGKHKPAEVRVLLGDHPNSEPTVHFSIAGIVGCTETGSRFARRPARRAVVDVGTGRSLYGGLAFVRLSETAVGAAFPG